MNVRILVIDTCIVLFGIVKSKDPAASLQLCLSLPPLENFLCVVFDTGSTGRHAQETLLTLRGTLVAEEDFKAGHWTNKIERPTEIQS